MHTLTGSNKEEYLETLLHNLTVLQTNILQERPLCTLESIQDMGARFSWDWSLLPTYDMQYQTLANVLEHIKQNYSWLQTIDNITPEKNRAYIKEINISPDTGLPWIHDISNLHRLQKEAKKELFHLPPYEDITKDLLKTLYADNIARNERDAYITGCRTKALQRSFFEQIQHAPLIGWEPNKQHITVEQTADMGAITQWRINMLRYSMASGFYQFYTVDLWQDKQDEVLKVQDNTISVHPQLQSSLNYSDNNPAWFVISDLDKNFPSIHPVHALKAFVGPFENKYMTRRNHDQPIYEISKQLLKEDPTYNALRMKIQYSFAPNSTFEKDHQTQEIIQEDWHDMIISAPRKYAATVSEHLRGDAIRIFES